MPKTDRVYGLFWQPLNDARELVRDALPEGLYEHIRACMFRDAPVWVRDTVRRSVCLDPRVSFRALL